MHLKENKITYFSLFGPRGRPLCSADKMKKICRPIMNTSLLLDSVEDVASTDFLLD
ncbi:hypothetical protein TSAR_004555, partial [Trichomalopsis sarcophagae]